MGINSSGYPAGANILNGPNNAYLYSTGNDLAIGNASASKNMIFFTGGLTPGIMPAGNERIRIQSNGYVGINNVAPNSNFSVTGSVSYGYKTVSSQNYTILADDYVILSTYAGGSGQNYTLPNPATCTCTGRIYRIINYGATDITFSPDIVVDNGLPLGTLQTTSRRNTVETMSNGTNWIRIAN
jgi:hypothetical protein